MKKQNNIRNIVIPVLFGAVCFCIGLAPVHGALNGVVAGKVLDRDGQGIADVVVTLRSQDGSSPELTTTSNRKGSYRFPNVHPGMYIVVAEAEGYRHASQPTVRVGSNNKINLDLFLDSIVTEPVEDGQE